MSTLLCAFDLFLDDHIGLLSVGGAVVDLGAAGLIAAMAAQVLGSTGGTVRLLDLVVRRLGACQLPRPLAVPAHGPGVFGCQFGPSFIDIGTH